MKIMIEIRGHSVSFFPDQQERFVYNLQGSKSIRDILVDLGVNPHLIMGVLVNGKLSNKDYLPVEGDTVILLSPPSGG